MNMRDDSRSKINERESLYMGIRFEKYFVLLKMPKNKRTSKIEICRAEDL